MPLLPLILAMILGACSNERRLKEETPEISKEEDPIANPVSNQEPSPEQGQDQNPPPLQTKETTSSPAPLKLEWIAQGQPVPFRKPYITSICRTIQAEDAPPSQRIHLGHFHGSIDSNGNLFGTCSIQSHDEVFVLDDIGSFEAIVLPDLPIERALGFAPPTEASLPALAWPLGGQEDKDLYVCRVRPKGTRHIWRYGEVSQDVQGGCRYVSGDFLQPRPEVSEEFEVLLNPFQA